MKNFFPLTQVAAKMSIDEQQLGNLLLQLGIIPKDQQLSREQVQQLTNALDCQRTRVEQAQLDKLDHLVKNYSILIDTCSLLHPKFPLLVQHMGESLMQRNKKLFIPASVIDELKRLSQKKPQLQARIKTLFSLLTNLRRQGLISVCGEKASFGDHQILETVLHFMVNTELLVITQDRKLTSDLLSQKQLQSVHGKKVAVACINSYGFLSRHYPLKHSKGRTFRMKQPVLPTPALIPYDASPLPVHAMPTIGDWVYTSTRMPFQLIRKLSSGGEGTVYDLGDGTVAKVYSPKRLTAGIKSKLTLMIHHPIDYPGICWPTALLYNEAAELIGYRMNYAQGTDLKTCVFTPAGQHRYFPHWKRRDLVQLCITILEKFCFLHERGIILGDINPRNILVLSPAEVWFVDCDSYQVGGHPCLVGDVYFTAPEISGKRFSDFLRTYGNENFAIATLLFMILMLGKQPYAQCNGKMPDEQIKEMYFPYPCGENHRQVTPSGNWRFVWSHLPRYLKEYFYQTFQKGGRYSTERTRLSPQKWYHALSYYLTLLDENKLNDEESYKLIPTRFKVSDSSKLAIYQQSICTDCAQPFDITIGEYEYRKQRSWNLPHLCLRCREQRRMEQALLCSEQEDS